VWLISEDVDDGLNGWRFVTDIVVGMDDDFLGGRWEVGAAVGDDSVCVEAEFPWCDVSDDAEGLEIFSEGHVLECEDGWIVWAELGDGIFLVGEEATRGGGEFF